MCVLFLCASCFPGYILFSPPAPAPRRVGMSSQSLWSFCDGVRDEFEGWTRDLLGRVARDYQLKESELITRYLGPGAPQQSPVSLAMVAQLPPVPAPVQAPVPAPVPAPVQAPLFPGAKKRGRKPAPGIESLDLSRPLSVDEIQGLTIPTLKAVCKHHGLKVTGSRPELVERLTQWQSNPDDPQLKKKKGGRAKRPQGPREPEHNHAVDDKIHADCEQCQAYGNPLAPEARVEEFHVVEDPPAAAPAPAAAPVPAPVPAPVLVPEEDFEIAPAVDPQAALDAADSPVNPEIQEVPPSPRADLKSKLAALLAADQDEDEDDEDYDAGSQCSYGDEILGDEDNLEMENFDYE